jgi:hypothetical protein
MTNDEFIKSLIKLAQELERDAQYVDCHNFTDNVNRQTDFVLEGSATSYRRASNQLYNLIAEYYVSEKRNCSYSNKINYIIKQRNNRVLSL